MSSLQLPPRLVIIGASGWYGKTLIHEYVVAYGREAAFKNLQLYGSHPSQLEIEIEDVKIVFPVNDLAEASRRSFTTYDGLIWYAFVLKNRLSTISKEEYWRKKQLFAENVFACLNANLHLRIIYFSSGVAYGLKDRPSYQSDPYAHLKMLYEHKLRGLGELVTFYPYATLGKYVRDHRLFAASSFIYQAMKSGQIEIRARMPVIRSYGYVNDFSRLILRLYEEKDWKSADIPSKIVPVTHTIDLIQLANEIADALGQSIKITSSVDAKHEPSIYSTTNYAYTAHLKRFGIAATPLRQQLLDM